jgi:hypothetical protein
MSSKYTISDHQDAHFISFASVQWEVCNPIAFQSEPVED